MKVIQHNTPFNHSFSKNEISPNLISFLEMIKQQFSFDQARIYHLTNENISDYKGVLIESIRNRIALLRGIGPHEKQDSLFKETTSEFDSIIEARIFPLSLIIFDYVYGSTVESSTVFFKEHNDMLMINTKFSTLNFEKRYFYAPQISSTDGRYYPPVVETLAYESSTTPGLFPFASFLLPVSIENNQFENFYQDIHHKKAELQLRELDGGQFDFKQLTLPPNFDIHQFVSRHNGRPKVLNSKLIYNNEVIFNDYEIIDRDPQKMVHQKLMPFLTDFKSQYEIIDSIPVKVSAEYYQHFKANILPVIEMVNV
jgi:hypothetical protein